MEPLVGLAGLALIFVVLLDAFETIVLPRRVTGQIRPTRLFYSVTWRPWSAIARRMRAGNRRENFLGFFGPLSLIMLLAVWASGLILGFGMLQYALGSALNVYTGTGDFPTDLYLSGTTFFTLGFGDVVPTAFWPRLLAIVESGLGFAFLGLVVGYLPALNQAFSRREIRVSLLDERAGSPPSAVEMLRRHGQHVDMNTIEDLLGDWEQWAAELLEGHLSYPVLAFFRSQHDNQSWLSALTTILDTCALVIVGVDGASGRQAQLTFAMARHASVDLSQVLNTRPRLPDKDRLPPEDLARARRLLGEAGVILKAGEQADRKLVVLREMYEPYVNALSQLLLMTLPPWLPSEDAHDAWQTTGWELTR